jgi:hypothetical protein
LCAERRRQETDTRTTFKSKDRFRGFEVFVRELEGGMKKALNIQREGSEHSQRRG